MGIGASSVRPRVMALVDPSKPSPCEGGRGRGVWWPGTLPVGIKSASTEARRQPGFAYGGASDVAPLGQGERRGERDDRTTEEARARSIAGATGDPGGLGEDLRPHGLSIYLPVRPRRNLTDEREAEEQPPMPPDGERGTDE